MIASAPTKRRADGADGAEPPAPKRHAGAAADEVGAAVAVPLRRARRPTASSRAIFPVRGTPSRPRCAPLPTTTRVPREL